MLEAIQRPFAVYFNKDKITPEEENRISTGKGNNGDQHRPHVRSRSTFHPWSRLWLHHVSAYNRKNFRPITVRRNKRKLNLISYAPFRLINKRQCTLLVVCSPLCLHTELSLYTADSCTVSPQDIHNTGTDRHICPVYTVRPDATKLSRRVGSGGVNWALHKLAYVMNSQSPNNTKCSRRRKNVTNFARKTSPSLILWYCYLIGNISRNANQCMLMAFYIWAHIFALFWSL